MRILRNKYSSVQIFFIPINLNITGGKTEQNWLKLIGLKCIC